MVLTINVALHCCVCFLLKQLLVCMAAERLGRVNAAERTYIVVVT